MDKATMNEIREFLKKKHLVELKTLILKIP